MLATPKVLIPARPGSARRTRWAASVADTRRDLCVP